MYLFRATHTYVDIFMGVNLQLQSASMRNNCFYLLHFRMLLLPFSQLLWKFYYPLLSSPPASERSLCATSHFLFTALNLLEIIAFEHKL